jgi:hypothetical protein
MYSPASHCVPSSLCLCALQAVFALAATSSYEIYDTMLQVGLFAQLERRGLLVSLPKPSLSEPSGSLKSTESLVLPLPQLSLKTASAQVDFWTMHSNMAPRAIFESRGARQHDANPVLDSSPLSYWLKLFLISILRLYSRSPAALSLILCLILC